VTKTKLACEKSYPASDKIAKARYILGKRVRIM
jgi:hypothetical protein